VAVRTSLTALRQQATRVLDLVPSVRRLLSELSRIELLDRSLALGAQALLALIPMLMVLGTVMPTVWVEGMVQQIRDVVGLREDVMAPIRELAVAEQVRRTETGVIGLVVSLASASAFSRALQRMYARAWELPSHRGMRALRSSLVWILGWLAVLQATALLLRSLAAVPNSGLLRTTVQLVTNTLLWWWTSRLLLGGRVSWRRLLPGAALTAVLLVTLTRLSSVFMPPFTRSNLEQFGPLGVVFAVGSWLVLFGGVLVVATVVGRQVSLWWLPAVGDAGGGVGEDAVAPSGTPARFRRPGLPGRYAAGQEQRDEGDHGQHEQGRPKAG
jgi:membrane protein